MLRRLRAEFSQRPRRPVELHLFHPVAFDLAFDPQKHLRPCRLRARVAAPEAPGQRGEEEQRQRGENQQGGEVEQVLGPQYEAEDIELPPRKIEQHGLPVAPDQPGCQIVDPHKQGDSAQSQARKKPVDFSGVYLLALLVESLLDRLIVARPLDLVFL